MLSLGYISGLKANGYYQLAAGYGTIGYEPNVNTFFGQPRSITTGGVAFDIPLINVTANKGGDAEKARQFTLQMGTLSSALEHITPEQMFATTNPNDEQPDAISAVKALQKASAAGQKIYQINQANLDQVLPLLHHDSDTISEITRAVNAGKDVTTHTDAVSIPGGWSGFGYIITDPVLGDGVYKISGGSNGGWGWTDSINSLLMIGATDGARQTYKNTVPKIYGPLSFLTNIAGMVKTFNDLEQKCGTGTAAVISGLLFAFNQIAGDVSVAVAAALIVSSIVFTIIFVVMMAVLIQFVNELVTTIASGVCDGSLVKNKRKHKKNWKLV